jgi:hypothetical protein
MPTDVEILDLADAIATEFAVDGALSEPVSVRRDYDPTLDIQTIKASDRAILYVVPAEEADELDARAVWNEDYGIDVAIRKRIVGTSADAVRSEMDACVKLLRSVKNFHRVGERDFTRSEITALWSPAHLKEDRIYFGVVRLFFTNPIDIEGE